MITIAAAAVIMGVLHLRNLGSSIFFDVVYSFPASFPLQFFRCSSLRYGVVEFLVFLILHLHRRRPGRIPRAGPEHALARSEPSRSGHPKNGRP